MAQLYDFYENKQEQMIEENASASSLWKIFPTGVIYPWEISIEISPWENDWAIYLIQMEISISIKYSPYLLHYKQKWLLLYKSEHTYLILKIFI